MDQQTGAGFDLTPSERDTIGQAALQWVLQYFADAADGRVYPAATADQLQAMVAERLPRVPQDPAKVLEDFAALATLGRNNGHPRMFGYVQSSGAFAGVIGDFLASALNQNVTSWRSAPSAATIELQVIDWIKEFVGYGSGAAGLLLSGGSLANFAALAVAVRASTDADVNDRGVGALAGPPRIYASTMAHMSISKAAAMLGIGRSAVQMIPVDAEFRMDIDALRRQIVADKARGCHIICIVGNAGEVNTGAIDPLSAIADVCEEHRVWFHIDGAYGGFAASATSVTSAMRGIARADSITLDPHKWLFASLDAGCLLVRDGADLRRTFSHGAAYVDVIADGGMSELAFWDYGPELSRRFRALKIWFIMKCCGATALLAAIEHNMAVARHLAAAVDESPDFERLAPTPLSIVCFRYVPAGARDATARGDAPTIDGLNALNRRLMVEVQRDGDAYLSNAMLGPAFALRACIVNYRTSIADVERLLTTIRRVAERIAADGPPGTC